MTWMLKGWKRVGDAAFLTLTTSPGNHQAWVAISDIEEDDEAIDFGRRLRKGAGADESATGATRVAGTVNYKRKYEPDFPTVKIDEAHPGRIVSKAQLEAMGIVAAPDLETAASEELLKARQTGPSQYRHRANKTWPDYGKSLAGAPPNRTGTGPDRSMADYTWCMTAIDWGWSIEETAGKLPEVSERARRRVDQLRDVGVSTNHRPECSRTSREK
jgi:RepB DNA-primase from phage plasmid